MKATLILSTLAILSALSTTCARSNFRQLEHASSCPWQFNPDFHDHCAAHQRLDCGRPRVRSAPASRACRNASLRTDALADGLRFTATAPHRRRGFRMTLQGNLGSRSGHSELQRLLTKSRDSDWFWRHGGRLHYEFKPQVSTSYRAAKSPEASSTRRRTQRRAELLVNVVLHDKPEIKRRMKAPAQITRNLARSKGGEVGPGRSRRTRPARLAENPSRTTARTPSTRRRGL